MNNHRDNSSSARVFQEFADSPAVGTLEAHGQHAHVAKHWMWLSADPTHTPTSAAIATTAIGIGLGPIPVILRLKLRLQALYLAQRRRQLRTRLAQLRLDVAQLGHDELRLLTSKRQALAQHGGGLHVTQAGNQPAQCGKEL